MWLRTERGQGPAGRRAAVPNGRSGRDAGPVAGQGDEALRADRRPRGRWGPSPPSPKAPSTAVARPPPLAALAVPASASACESNQPSPGRIQPAPAGPAARATTRSPAAVPSARAGLTEGLGFSLVRRDETPSVPDPRVPGSE
ncbi:hypothetical protein ACE1SV_08770 [Streptomyces sp. E-15]